MRVIIFFILFLISCGGGSGNNGENKEKIKWLYQLQNINPYEVANSGFKIAVIDYSRDGTPEGELTKEELNLIKKNGIIPLAYISIGEAEDYRFYWKEEWENNPPEWLSEENPEWEGNYAVKYWYDEWKNIIYRYVDKVIQQGFSGIYLDKVDEFEYWASKDKNITEEETARRMIRFILEIINYARRKAGKDFIVIPQNGERILKYDDGSLENEVSGWGSEDVFFNGLTSWNEEEQEYIKKKRIPYLKRLVDKGKIVLSVEYIDDGTGYRGKNKERIDEYLEKAKLHNFIPYIAIYDRELDEINVIEGIQP
ncbi:endo alpha-1,4 polygalactosaminidase [Aquifex pyrophilus]